MMPLRTVAEELEFADIYEITLSTRAKLYLTNYGGTYFALPPIGDKIYQVIPITRTKASYHSTLQTDTIDISFGIHSFTVSGRSIIEAIKLGWFDNAEVIISIINPKMVTEIREVFRGTVGKEIKFDRKECKLYATGGLDLQKQTVPGVFYQEQCNHRLYDTYCRVTKATFERAGTAGAGSTRTRIISPVFAFSVTSPAGFFVLGEIRMTSGANNGVSRIIRFHNNGNVDVYIPFDFDIAVGDRFLAYAGCDKSGTTCHARFANIINFLGFEYIPRPEIMFG